MKTWFAVCVVGLLVAGCGGDDEEIITVYRYDDDLNTCSLTNILELERTALDFDTDELCQTNVVEEVVNNPTPTPTPTSDPDPEPENCGGPGGGGL